jgi:hypothetical protein
MGKGWFNLAAIESTNVRAEFQLDISLEDRNALLRRDTCLSLSATFDVIVREQDKTYDKDFFGPVCLGNDPKYIEGRKQAIIITKGPFLGKEYMSKRVIIKFLALNKKLNTYPVKITVENFYKDFYQFNEPDNVKEDKVGEEIVANIVRVGTPTLSYVGNATWKAILKTEKQPYYEFTSNSPETYLPTEIGYVRSKVDPKLTYSQAIVVGIPKLQ